MFKHSTVQIKLKSTLLNYIIKFAYYAVVLVWNEISRLFDIKHNKRECMGWRHMGVFALDHHTIAMLRWLKQMVFRRRFLTRNHFRIGLRQRKKGWKFSTGSEPFIGLIRLWNNSLSLVVGKLMTLDDDVVTKQKWCTFVVSN